MTAKGTRVWTCDGCGKRETWRKGWGYAHGVVSLENRHEDSALILPLATCSEACMGVALEQAITTVHVGFDTWRWTP